MAARPTNLAVLTGATKVIEIPSKVSFKKPRAVLPWPRNSDPDPITGKIVPLGIDIVAKKKDIEKVIHKFFKIKDYPMEDLLQEVFATIAHKNHTPSAHNPNKSSLGHYLYFIGQNLVCNIVNKNKKHRANESLEAHQHGGDDSKTLQDLVDEEVSAKVEETRSPFEEVEEIMRQSGMWDHARYIRAVKLGVNSSVVREALSWGDRVVSNKTIRDLKEQIRESAYMFKEFL